MFVEKSSLEAEAHICRLQVQRSRSSDGGLRHVREQIRESLCRTGLRILFSTGGSLLPLLEHPSDHGRCRGHHKGVHGQGGLQATHSHVQPEQQTGLFSRRNAQEMLQLAARRVRL